MFSCARTRKPYHEPDCLETILGTARSEDLPPCRACPRGRAMMSTIVYGRVVEVEGGNQEAAPKAMTESAPLPDVGMASAPPLAATRTGRPWARFLARLIRCHGEDTGFGYGLSLWFVANEARKEGFTGTTHDLSKIFKHCGLTVIKEPLLTLVVDARLRRFAYHADFENDFKEALRHAS